MYNFFLFRITSITKVYAEHRNTYAKLLLKSVQRVKITKQKDRAGKHREENDNTEHYANSENAARKKHTWIAYCAAAYKPSKSPITYLHAFNLIIRLLM